MTLPTNDEELTALIDKCAVHPEWDDDCEVCKASALECQELIKQYGATTQHLFQELGREGARIDPGSIVALRLDTFLEMALSPKDRFRFEVRCALKQHESMEQSLSQVRQAKLAAGANGVPPSMYKDLKKRH